MWDLAVVGAGPAGSAAALAALRARPTARVLVLDRAAFPRDKICGDGVAPHVIDVLGELGAPSPVADRVPVSELELSLGESRVVRPMRREAWVVPREVLDARLLDAALAAGAEFAVQRVRTVTVRPDHVVLDRGTDQEVRARVVVGADGAPSQVARALGLRHRGRMAVALRGYALTPPERAGRQVIHFGQQRQPSYAWSFDRGDGWSNVGYGELVREGDPLSPALAQERLEELLPGATRGLERWRGHLLPLSTARWTHPSGRVLLAGDAAGLVNPLTGEGIYYAVATGALAGRTAVIVPDDGAGAAYGRVVRRLLARHLRTTAALSRLSTVPGLLPAGLRAAAADQGVFEDLGEIGLGRGVATARMLRALLASIRPFPGARVSSYDAPAPR
ncbi:MAG TPA: geranylgeranyl reductase family protein [Ornithinicoccus sp.]|jgi:geranylgeranyl reductase family protein|nr:geranylgeranyl reductase family protein [Ornithinicoccus sp.]